MKYLILLIIILMCNSCKTTHYDLTNTIKLKEYDNPIHDYHAEEYHDTLKHTRLLVVTQKGVTKITRIY